MKRGKEFKVDVIPNLNVVFGTTDNKKPKSVYINISGWADPIDNDNLNYNRIIQNIHKQIKQNIYNYGNHSIFNLNRTIVDFDMRQSGIIFGKRSYMNCEIVLYQNSEYALMSDELNEALMNILNVVVNKNLNDNKYFKFHRKKE